MRRSTTLGAGKNQQPTETMHRLFVLLLFTALFLGNSSGGELISLQNALETALRSGYDVAIVRAERDAADADAAKSLSVFLPQIRLSSSVTATNDPLNVFGMKLRERRVSPSDFMPEVLNYPDRFTQYSTKIEVQQPLINLDGFWGRAAAQDAARATEMKESRTRHYVSFRVKAAYYGLVLARAGREVTATALRAAGANEKLSKEYFDQGLINKSDYLFAQVRLLDAQSKHIEAENAVRNAEGALRILLGRSDGVELVPTDTLAAPQETPEATTAEAVNAARSDMRAMQYGVDAAEAMLRSEQFKLLPSLNAFGSYDVNDQKLLGRQGAGWMIGAMVQWDIFPGSGRVAGIQKASANLDRARTELDRQRAQNANDIEDAFRSFDAARKRAALAEESVRQSSENYRILSERYASGIGKTTDLLNAEAGLAGARLDHLHALYASNVALFTIELLTEQHSSIQ